MTHRLPFKLKSLVPTSQHLQCRPLSSFPVRYAPPPDGPSLVKSFLYGSEKGQELQREMEQSYSKVLARGKYVHKMNQHHVKPDKINEYIALMFPPPLELADLVRADVFPKIANDPENQVHLVGSWRTTVGPLDTFTHIWEYRGYPGYDMTVARQETQPYYQRYRKEVGSHLISRRSDLMQEFAFWNTVPPRALGGIFELRTYGLKPGKLLEWEGHWRKGLEVRKNFMEPIGAWFTQIGTLNRVYHIWQFPGTRYLE